MDELDELDRLRGVSSNSIVLRKYNIKEELRYKFHVIMECP